MQEAPTVRRPSPDSAADTRDVIVEVVAGPESTCARTGQGRVACVGHGVEYTDEKRAFDTHVPRVVPVPPSKSISAGEGFACSVDRDGGKVRCWGYNGAGQLGRETPDLVDQWPLEVPGLEGTERLVTHGPRTCALKGEALWCWPGHDKEGPVAHPLASRDPDRALFDLTHSGQALGFNFNGGDTKIDRPWRERLHARCPFFDPDAPEEVMEDDLFDPYDTYRCNASEGIEVGPGAEVGKDHACRLAQGKVSCEGPDTVGQAPSDPPNLGAPVLDIAVGSEHTCAVISVGELRCWGSSTRGQLGIEPVHSRPPVLAASDVAQAWVTDGLTCLQTTKGSFACAGQSGDPCASPDFAPLEGPNGIQEMFEALGSAGCLIDSDGALWCMEDDSWERHVAPEAFAGASASRQEFGADYNGRLCWLAEGRPTCARWQPPDGNFPEVREEPFVTEAPFGPLDDVLQLRWYGSGLCALDRAGVLRCKGAPGHERRTTWAPVEVPEQSVARLLNDGWQLKDGTFSQVWRLSGRGSAPLSLSGHPLQPPDAAAVADASGDCVVTEAGRLWCANDEFREPPNTTFKTVASATHHACAIDEDHGLWCWGDATRGRLGVGPPVCDRTPHSLSGAFHDAWESAALHEASEATQ